MFTLMGADIFDGDRFLPGASLVVEGGRVAAILPAGTAPRGEAVHLEGGILAPGLVDLQVNGGGGLQVGGDTSADDLAAICETHARLGSTGVLPTLITDTPEATANVIASGIECARRSTPGFLGLHLEGPHLDPRREGAHDPGLIRPMTETDLRQLVAARRDLPALMVTVAPSGVTPGQITRLARAGVVVSLGHAECTGAEAEAAIAAGARCATHLFNAMSPLGHREPGLVGTILSTELPAGLIADGLHVAPQVLRLALRLRPTGLFLVSDCMAFAGSDLSRMRLGGREILRGGGRLTLGDGTLAGADLTLPEAIGRLAALGVPLANVLRMASATPASVIGASSGRLRPGDRADLVHLTADHALSAVWRGGRATVAPVLRPAPQRRRLA